MWLGEMNFRLVCATERLCFGFCEIFVARIENEDAYDGLFHDVVRWDGNLDSDGLSDEET